MVSPTKESSDEDHFSSEEEQFSCDDEPLNSMAKRQLANS